MFSDFLRALMLLLLSQSVFAAKGGLKLGDIPPDKLGKTPAGELIQLSNHRGAIVVISFWASWCAPCRTEMSVLESVQKQVDPGRLKVVAVNIEDRQTFRKIVRTLKDVNLTLTSDPNGVVSRAYKVGPIPHTVIVGPDGRIAAMHLGFSEARLEPLVAELNQMLAKAGG